MKRYETTDQADQDLEEIAMYLVVRNESAAKKTLYGIFKTFSLLATSPEVGVKRTEFPGDLRSIPSGSFIVFYKPQEWGVEVVRVLHGNRDIQAVFNPPEKPE